MATTNTQGHIKFKQKPPHMEVVKKIAMKKKVQDCTIFILKILKVFYIPLKNSSKEISIAFKIFTSELKRRSLPFS